MNRSMDQCVDRCLDKFLKVDMDDILGVCSTSGQRVYGTAYSKKPGIVSPLSAPPV